MSRAEERALGRRDARAADRQDRKLRPERRRTCWPGRASCPGAGWTGGPGRRSVRWVGNQGSRWGSCTPVDRTIRLSDRLQGMPAWVVDYVLRARAGPPAGARARAGLLGRVERLPAHRAGPRLPRGRVRDAPGSTSPTTEPAARPEPAATSAAPRSLDAAPGRSPAALVDREPRDVVGLVADHAARRRAAPPRRTARRGARRSVPNADDSSCRSRSTGPSPTSRSPSMPDSSVASRSAASASVASPGSQWPPSCAQKPPLRCSVSSTRSPVWSSTSALAVRCAGDAAAQHAVVVASQVLDVRRAQLLLVGRPGAPPSAVSVAQRVGVARRTSAGPSRLVGLGRRRRCRPGRRGPAARSRRPAKPAGSSRSSAVGSRSGCAQTASRPSLPRVGEHGPPQRGGLAQPARPQLEPDQGGERRLGRPAAGPPAAHGLAQRGRPRAAGRWPPRRRPRRPSPRPAPARSRAGPARPSARGCPRARTARRSAPAAATPGWSGRCCRPPPRAREVSTRDAAGVGGDRVDEVRAQPRHVREQPLVRRLAQRQVEPHLVGGHLEPGAERGDVGGQQRRRAGRRERQPDVGRARPPRAASAPMAWPIWVPNIAPPMLRIICCSGPASAAACSGIAPSWAIGPPSPASIVPIESTTLPATGSTSSRHAGSVASTHSARLQALTATCRRGNAVASSSHSSASRIASSTCSRSAVGDRPVAGRGHGLPGDVARQVPVDRAALVGQQLRRAGRRPRRCRRPPPISAENGSAGWSPAPARRGLVVVVGRTRVEAEGEVAHVSPHVASADRSRPRRCTGVGRMGAP